MHYNSLESVIVLTRPAYPTLVFEVAGKSTNMMVHSKLGRDKSLLQEGGGGGIFVCLTCLVYFYLEMRWGWPRGTTSAAWHCMLLKHS
jgi:hypothetical protein